MVKRINPDVKAFILVIKADPDLTIGEKIELIREFIKQRSQHNENIMEDS